MNRLVRPLTRRVFAVGVLLGSVAFAELPRSQAVAQSPTRPGAIAFTHEAHGTFQISAIQPDGTSLRQLTSIGSNMHPAYSPDGTVLAFASNRDGQPSADIYVMSADGSFPHRLTTGTGTFPTWSPDGSQIAFARYGTSEGSAIPNYDVWVMNADGSGETNITDDPAEDIEPDWSTTNRIAFRTNRTGNSEIFTMNPDGGELTNVTKSATGEGEPRWAPSGTALAYYSSGANPNEATLVIHDLDTGESYPLPGSAHSGTASAWSPDGRRLAVSFGATGITVFDPQGCVEPRPVGISALPSGPVTMDWQPTPEWVYGEREFTALTPARVLDTRDGTGMRLGSLPPGSKIDVQIAGVGGVPASGVNAVALNAVMTDTSAPSYLTVWPTGQLRPTVSNLNVSGAHQTASNMVMVGLGDGGKVSVFNNSGSTHVVLDVLGFFGDDHGPPGGRFHGITPTRLFDTRDVDAGFPPDPLGPGETVSVDLSCFAGLPDAGLNGVVMNVTVTQPTSPGFLTVYPGDVPLPLASNVNFQAGRTVPNLVIVRVPPSGVVNFYNAHGSTHVIADVVGYFDDDRTTGEGRFFPVVPTRLLDTRTDPHGFLGPDEYGTLAVAGEAMVPTTFVDSVVLNTTVTQPTKAGYLTVFPDDDCEIPYASNLNFSPGQTVPNLVISRVSRVGGCAVLPGAVDFYNSHGNTHVIIDVFGYFTADVAG